MSRRGQRPAATRVRAQGHDRPGRWRTDPSLQAWLSGCRLNGMTVQMRGMLPDDAARMALVRAVGAELAG